MMTGQFRTLELFLCGGDNATCSTSFCCSNSNKILKQNLEIKVEERHIGPSDELFKFTAINFVAYLFDNAKINLFWTEKCGIQTCA